MRFYSRLLVACGGLSLALTVAWTTAFVARIYSTRLPPRPAVIREARDFRLAARASSLGADYFVASEIGKVYHHPDCFYAAKQMKHSTKRFSTAHEAEAAGLKPCTNCIQNIAVSP